LGLDPQRDRTMVYLEMTSNSAQVHPVHIQLKRFLTHLLRISPGFRFWRVLELTEHAAIALAAAACFSGSVLPFGSVTFWTCNHADILSFWPNH
jgi:hypothetical protein